MKKKKKLQNNSLPVVIFLGQQGSGKGTQAKLLVEKYNFAMLEMGGLLRAEAKRGTKLGKLIAGFINQGKLVPSWIPELLVKQELPKLGSKKIVMDGAPRQYVEAVAHDRNIRKVGRRVSLIIFIKLTDKETFKRLALRGRNDDTIEAIKTRLAWSKAKLGSIVKYFKSRGYPVEFINGEQSVAKVQKDILATLKKYQII